MKTATMTESVKAAVGTVLEFKWTVSRGQDTYGYNICTLRDRYGKRLARCNGGGYDMKGTCLGDWIESAFQDALLELAREDKNNFDSWYEDGCRWERIPTDYYGVTWNHYKNGREKIVLDGACGFNSMRKILNALGLDLKWLHETKKTDLYEVVEVTSATVQNQD